MKLSFSLSFLERKRNSLLCNWRLAWYPRVCVSILKKEMIYTRIFSFLPKSSFCFPCVYNGCRLAHKNVYNIFSSSYIIIKKNLSTGRLRLLIEVIMSYHEWVNDESPCWKKKHVIIIHFSSPFLHRSRDDGGERLPVPLRLSSSNNTVFFHQAKIHFHF